MMNKTKKYKKKTKNKIKKKKSTRNNHLYNKKIRGGSINPISQLWYSMLGTGESIYNKWNGLPSSFSNVNPSPEVQKPIDTYYESNHNII